MTTDLVEERLERLQLIRDSARSVVPVETGAQRARALRFQQPGFDRTKWQEMSSLGWSGLRVPEDKGGSGLDVAALCAVAQQLGASLSPEPFIGVAGVAQLLQGDWLQSVLAGERIVVPAWLERPNDLAASVQTRFLQGRVSGVKRLVAGAAGANGFVVSTCEGPVLVERDAPGVALTIVALHDGGFVGDLRLEDAPATPLTSGAGAAAAFERIFEESALANAAYVLGAMEAAFDMTLAYMTVRKQFGKPIGSFQALQHRAVDLKIQLELTRAVVNEALRAMDDGAPPQDCQALVSRAKMRAAGAGMLIAKESVQFHGAMGMTDECDVGLYARKILAVHNDWGSTVAHRQRFATLELTRHG